MLENLDWTSISTSLADLAVLWGARLLGALFMLVIAWWVSRLLAKAMLRFMGRTHVDPSVGAFLGSAVRVSVLGVGVLLSLGVFGVEMTSIAALVGGAGIAVGLALQGNLSNLATGLVILAVRPFRVGHHVEVAGKEGIVDAIDLMTTHLRTFDGADVIIPNELVFKSPITNHDSWETRRVDVYVGVNYSSNLDKVVGCLMEVAAAVPERIQDKESTVRFQTFGDSSLNFRLSVWVPAADRFVVHHELMLSVKKAFDAAGIGIPFPQRDLHLIGDVRHRALTNDAENV